MRQQKDVCILSIEEMRHNFNVFKDALGRFGLDSTCGSFQGKIKSVRHSPEKRSIHISEEDIRAYIARL